MNQDTEKQTFEGAMHRLEEIVSELEKGEVSLEESLKKFEEGMALTKFCAARLNEVEKKIKVLVKSGDDFDLKESDT
ncbi:MAG: exodeoxyribonuclease VII small subunit [bacterium]